MEISEEKIKYIIYLYDTKKESINKISKENGIDQRTIKSILLKNNIPIRSNNFYKNKSVDSNFFEKIDTQEKAYILGFIYADGCLTNGALQIKVSIKDIGILCKIKYSLKSDHKITRAINHNGYGIDNEYCSLEFSDLIKNILDKIELAAAAGCSKIELSFISAGLWNSSAKSSDLKEFLKEKGYSVKLIFDGPYSDAEFIISW